MKKEKETQIIIVNRSLVDDSIQIVIPPFRPINMYELEDNFDGVVDEIESYVLDKTVAKQVIGFVSAFKDSLEEQDVLPIVEYFMKHEIILMLNHYKKNINTPPMNYHSKIKRNF